MSKTTGTIKQIIGVVVDVEFTDQLPEIYNALETKIKGKKLILEAYEKSADKKIIILENSFPRFLFQKVLSSLPEPIYVISPSRHSDVWKVEAVRKNFDTMDGRKLFPKSWWGFFNSDPKLKEITGVSDVMFCHRNGFLTIALSKEGAIKLANLALND